MYRIKFSVHMYDCEGIFPSYKDAWNPVVRRDSNVPARIRKLSTTRTPYELFVKMAGTFLGQYRCYGMYSWYSK